MLVHQIQINNITNRNLNRYNITQNNHSNSNANTKTYSQIPLNYRGRVNISFGEIFNQNRTVPDIDYEEYMTMSETTKKRLRKRYKTFFNNPKINPDEIIDPNYKYMPLLSEELMDNFIETSKIYNKFKDHKIICLGRSPKWFLNTSLWMKDGINKYDFVAFSKNWYNYDYNEDILVRTSLREPTPKEETAYRKYLNRIKADPQTIVNEMKKSGKKTIITDYVYSSKGITSFLDIMSKYAEDLGILKEFCNSIHFVTIGSLDYMEEMLKTEEINPRVRMPERMAPYEKSGLWTYHITQEYHNMDYSMFKEMLINQNTNECRSTYYPHETWTIYQPDRFKTGFITDMKKVKEMLKQLKSSKHRSMSSFTPTMADYRNLLNFRILDGLNERGLLKTVHKSKL